MNLAIPSPEELASNPKAYYEFARELAYATFNATVLREVKEQSLADETTAARVGRSLDEKEWVREFDYPGENHCCQGETSVRGRYRLRGTSSTVLCLKCFKERSKDSVTLREEMEYLIES